MADAFDWVTPPPAPASAVAGAVHRAQTIARSAFDGGVRAQQAVGRVRGDPVASISLPSNDMLAALAA